MTEKDSSTPQTKTANENGLLNVLFSVVIPVIILNKLSKWWAPVPALLVALAFPIGFGLWDLLKKRKLNGFALLGLINVSLTGGLALMHLEGIWFAVKEAAFPLLIGLFVLFSRYTRTPFIRTIFLNPQLMNTELIQSRLQEQHQKDHFENSIKRSTTLLACSFFFSATVNYILARQIFTPLAPELDDVAKSLALNEQIAHMTSLAAAVILVPSMIFLGSILWFLIRDIQKSTGLQQTEIFRS